MNPIRAARITVTLLLAAAAARAGNAIPHFEHVVIVIEENHSYGQIIGSANAPYINSLAAGGALTTQSFALTHPSQPNYVASPPAHPSGSRWRSPIPGRCRAWR